MIDHAIGSLESSVLEVLESLSSGNNPAELVIAGQERAPLVEFIREWRALNRTTYMSIGPKHGQAVDPEVIALLGRDVFESNAWINADTYESALREAEALAAELWDVRRTFFLVNGSSSANHAALMAVAGPGDEILVARDSHTSTTAGLVMSGASPVYIAPRLHPELDIGMGLDPRDVKEALDAHPRIRAITIVNPSFCGVASDLEAIIEIAHARSVAVIVDEAWGPHFHFHPELPISAVSAGADLVVSSIHKVLPALSQGSMLHVQGNLIDPQRLAIAVRMTQTTSPLVPIPATLDAVRRQLAMSGFAMMDRTLDLAYEVRRSLRRLPGIRAHSAADLGLPVERLDPTKLVIDVQELGITGFAAEAILNDKFGIAVELSDLTGIICNLSPADDGASADRLVTAIAALSADRVLSTRPTRSHHKRSSGKVIAPTEQIMTPRQAFFSLIENIELLRATDRVAARAVTPYPPGIPVLVPGELITSDKVEYLLEVSDQRLSMHGGFDSEKLTVAVVRE